MENNNSLIEAKLLTKDSVVEGFDFSDEILRKYAANQAAYHSMRNGLPN